MANGGVIHREQPSEVTAFAYANQKPCPCGRPLPVREAGTKGRGARYCGRCQRERKALRFARAAVRILEELRDPDYEVAE